MNDNTNKMNRRAFLAGGLSLAVAALTAGTALARPKYAWRGYMLDCSRHFFTVGEIKRTLDLMHDYDLNVFHWHFTDGHGWRPEIRRYPLLTERGSMRNTTTYRTTTMGADAVDGRYGPFFYTQDEMRDVVAYAAARGIRVVPEIEIPGHESAAIDAYPELGCEGLPNNGELCLGKETAFVFMENVLDEILAVFPGGVIHIGGDECRMANWKRCAKCQAKMRELGFTDGQRLQAWATERFVRYLEKRGRRLMGWDELAHYDNLPRSVIVQTYRGTEHGVTAAKKGFDVVMTPDVYTYFDYVQGLAEDPYEYQPFGTLLDVRKIGEFDLCGGVPEEFRRHVLGGQGEMWTELVTDMKGVEWRTWPRLAALADVMKNGPAQDMDAFLKKIAAEREKLVARGVNAAPLGPLFKPRPDLAGGARWRLFRADLGTRMDFAKMLDNPLDESVLRFDWHDGSEKYRRVYAAFNPTLGAGAYRLDLDWSRITATAADMDGFRAALAQLRHLRRMKADGHMEFSGGVVASDGETAGVSVEAEDFRGVGKAGEKKVILVTVRGERGEKAVRVRLNGAGVSQAADYDLLKGNPVRIEVVPTAVGYLTVEATCGGMKAAWAQPVEK